jgi:hypothetical protein
VQRCIEEKVKEVGEEGADRVGFKARVQVDPSFALDEAGKQTDDGD